jgi:hypothetical protein
VSLECGRRACACSDGDALPPAGAPQTQSGRRRRPLPSVVFALEVEAPAAQLGALLGALPGVAERLPRLLSARGFSTASALVTGEALKQARMSGPHRAIAGWRRRGPAFSQAAPLLLDLCCTTCQRGAQLEVR